MHSKTKKIVAGLLSLATIAPAFVGVAPLTASAGLVVGESTFDHKALPWHTCESSPAKQDFEFAGGAFHVTVENPEGPGEGNGSEKWDLQVRHRNLDFKAGHEYFVSFDAKSNRDGMELCSKIGDISGDHEYFELDGQDDAMHMGPHMGGNWPNSAVKLGTSYKTYSGTFKPTEDLEACEWCFHYAKGTKYQGNAQKGDEIWFDNLIIDCKTCGDKPAGEGCCNADTSKSYGAINRDYSTSFSADNLKLRKGGKQDGELMNFISVNQIGYYTDLAKTATLGDNAGDILYGNSEISLTKGQKYTWELVDASSGTAVESGETSAVAYDKESHDNVAKIDFSSYKKAGRYYLRIKGQDWRSFEFNIGDDIYLDKNHNMLTNALNYFYQNRSGIDIESAYITSGDKSTLAHQGGHKTDEASIQDAWINEYGSATDATGTHKCGTLDAPGGWYDAGDHGKYVVNGGISIWTLQNMFERAQFSETTKAKFADGSGTVVIPEAGNKIPDILDEAAVELDWMTKMKVTSADSKWGSKYSGMIYHKLHDHKWTGLATRPWNYAEEWKTVRIVKPPTFAATLNYAACAAQAARLWAPYDKTKAEFYLKEAVDAYNAYKPNWYEAKSDEETNPTSLYAPMNQAKGGGPYGDNEVRDDDYWASCEIFVSAKEMGDDATAETFYKHMGEYKNKFLVTTRITGGENASGEGSFTTFNWGNTASAGSLTLALHKDLLSDEEAKAIDDSIIKAAKEYIACENDEGYFIPYKYDGPGYTDENNLKKEIVIKGYEWGSNSMVINNLIVMAYAYDLTQNKDYLNGVLTGMNYLLGCNPLSFSFITGYGSYFEKNPHHRYWSYELDKTLPMAPDGVLSGGPNAGLQDPYVRALGFTPGGEDVPSERCFVDSIEAWSTNEVTINWNAPLAWIVEFLQDKDVEYNFNGESIIDPGTDDPGTDDPGTGDLKEADWGNADCSTEKDLRARVTVGDAVLIARVAGSDDTLTKDDIGEQGMLNADVVNDNSVDGKDLTLLIQWLANLKDYSELGKKPS